MQITPFIDISEQYKCIFFDAYGVLNGENGVFPWVEATFKTLRAANKPFYIVSNDSSNLIDDIASKFLGADGTALIEQHQIISSGLICQDYVAKHLANEHLIYFGEERSARYLADARTVTHIRDVSYNTPAAAFVLLGCGGMDWREGLDRCINYLRYHPGCDLLAPNPDILYFAGADRVGIAAGSLAGLIERAINRPFRYFGKPHNIIFAYALNVAAQQSKTGLKAEDILMVGDNLFTDIYGAKAMGFGTCLVLSGNTTRDNLQHEEQASGVKADFIAESIAV